ncbi:DNA-processing protein DprA [Pokkaliibacter sp. CJK22405]|uniref:DNA-processing protein DprA n=1 Tax=Pokkaliibacter sp. CJK22405 TaxID=3384615 RepID=UPI0039849774
MIGEHQYPYLLWQWLPGCGPKRWQALAAHFPRWPEPLLSPDALLLSKLPAQAVTALGSRDKPWQAAQDQLNEWLAKDPQHHLITFADPDYPALLRQISDAPPVLYVRGRRDALTLPQIALVGSRHASHQGNTTARAFARDLASQGMAITSGLALGIDAAAHQGALDAKGITLGIMGTGVDRLYPASHLRLAQEILEAGGALVSEFPLGTQPQRAFFPRRNRLISGLSVGVIVVEAALKSGSLSTARHAMSQNRAVFAIPGSIHNPLSRGCHAIIREGATLLDSTEQIADEVVSLLAYHYQQQPWMSQTPSSALNLSKEVSQSLPQKPDNSLMPESQENHPLWGYLDDVPRSVDELESMAQLPIEAILGQLLAWELEGKVALEAGGYVKVFRL